MSLTPEQIDRQILWIEGAHKEWGDNCRAGYLPTSFCSPLDFEPLKRTAIEFLGMSVDDGHLLPGDVEIILSGLAEKYKVGYPNTAIEAYELLRLYSLPTDEKRKLIIALSNDLEVA